MKSKHPSKKSMIIVIIFCFVLAAVLIIPLVAPSSPRGEYTDSGAPSEETHLLRNTSFMADQLFIFIIPIVVIFLLYIAYLLNTLVKNLNKTIVCTHDNPDCQYWKKYFPE